MLDDYSHLKAGLYIANPATGATKAISTSADWENLFGFAANGNASVSTIAATVAWVYSAIEERRKTLGQIEYTWELNGKPIEDSQLPFEFKTLNYAMRADKAIQLVGNAYLWKWRKENSRGEETAKIHALRWLDPRAIEADINSVVDGIGYTNYKYHELVGVYARQKDLPHTEIVRTFVEGLNELDPDSAAADAYNLAAQIIWGMEKTTDSFYDTNGLPIMLVKVAPGSNKRQQDDTQSSFKRIFQKRRDGAGNKVVAVSNDVEIVPLSFAPKDLAQAELSAREIRSIYAVMSIPLEFLETRGDTRAVHATRTLVLTMAARFQLLADALNEDADIKKAGLFLRILPENHPAMKIDMGLAFDAVMKGVSSGMSLEAALHFNGVDVDSLPDGVSLVNEQPEPETAVVEVVEEVEDETATMKAAELSQLRRFVRKGSHKKRPFSAQYLTKKAIKAEITAQDEAELEQLNEDLQALIEQAARGEIEQDTFESEYLALFLLALRGFAASGAAGELTPAGVAQLATMEQQAAESVGNLSDDIYAGRYSDGGVNPLTPDAEPFNEASAGQIEERGLDKIANRVALWTGVVTGAFSLGQVYSEANSGDKLMWVVGATDHCGDCLRLNGQVHTADEWAGVISPQSPELECRGYNCQCRLVDVPNEVPTSGGF